MSLFINLTVGILVKESLIGSLLLILQGYDKLRIYKKELLIIENNTGDAIITLQVYDVLGKLVLAENNPTNQSNVSTLKRGVFFIKITTAQGSLIKKMVKE